MPSYPPLSESPDLSGLRVDGRYRLVNKLGEGAYGSVWRAIDESSPTSSSVNEPKQYAIKVLEKADVGSVRWRHYQREIAVHTAVSDHPNIVNIHGMHECKNFVYIVLDYCLGGDLFNPMMRQLAYSRNSKLLKGVFVQILDAVEYCHSQGVYHRDLKPDNILSNAAGTALKLADFGLSTTSKISHSFGCGSSYYMSPECIGYESEDPFSNEASDVWALGIILANLAGARNPWAYATPRDVSYYRYLRCPQTFFRQQMPISEECAAVLCAVLNPDPIARITIPQLRERILAIEDFFMSQDDIHKANETIQRVALGYGLLRRELSRDEKIVRCQSVMWEEDVIALMAATHDLACTTTGTFYSIPTISSEDSLSDPSSDSDSGSDSEDPCPRTPQTCAQNAVVLVEVPELGESESGSIGQAASVGVAGKGRSTLGQSVPERVAVAGRA